MVLILFVNPEIVQFALGMMISSKPLTGLWALSLCCMARCMVHVHMNGRTKAVLGLRYSFGFVFSWIENGADLGVARYKAGLPSLTSSAG